MFSFVFTYKWSSLSICGFIFLQNKTKRKYRKLSIKCQIRQRKTTKQNFFTNNNESLSILASDLRAFINEKNTNYTKLNRTNKEKKTYRVFYEEKKHTKRRKKDTIYIVNHAYWALLRL